MKRIELGPVNLSVYGTQIYKLSRDADFFFSTVEMAECLISKISEADEMLIISLKRDLCYWNTLDGGFD